MPIILQHVPEFGPRWQAYRTYWESSEAGLCNDLGEFSHFARDLLADDPTELLPRVFALIEELMVNGDDHVKDATATCFLENLINRVPQEFTSASFFHLLGPTSRAYCKAWNEFTGIQNDGL